MLKKLVGFLTVLCLAIFISGCSSSPDVSGTYVNFSSKNNKPINAIIISRLENDTYDYTFLTGESRMFVVEKQRGVFKSDEKVLESQLNSTKLIFNKDLTVVTSKSPQINKEFIYKKLTDEEMKQYQYLFE